MDATAFALARETSLPIIVFSIAEPGAIIGFAGQRVIQETIRETLPPGFQRSEYLLDHGMVDMVVHRAELRETLARILGLLRQPRSTAAVVSLVAREPPAAAGGGQLAASGAHAFVAAASVAVGATASVRCVAKALAAGRCQGTRTVSTYAVRSKKQVGDVGAYGGAQPTRQRHANDAH